MEIPVAKTVTREALFELVWKEPATKLATQYNVPYPDFKKICDEMAVPIPGSGYWSKLRAGKEVPSAILPVNYSGPQTITIEPRKPGKKIALIANFPQEAVSDFEKLLRVPAKLTSPDPLIIAAKENLEKDKNLYNGLAGTGFGNISISVTPKNISRALRLMDALIKLLKACGYKVRVENNTTYVIIEEEKIEISLREKMTRSVIKEGNWDRSIYTPSGIISIKAGIKSWDSRDWKDGKLLLENRLADIVAYLEQKAQKEKEWRIQCEIAAAERRGKERIAREQAQLQENELNRFKNLLQEAKRWKEVKLLREYIADMKERATKKETTPEAHKAWLQWAEQKAAWYDPRINSPDELLDGIDKETLLPRKKSGLYGW